MKRLRTSTVNGKVGEPLAEGPVVLLGQHRRRHQHGHLLAVLDGLERRPHGQFGLAVADVAAQEPVHGDRLLHVGLDLADGADLVRRLLVREGFLELHLPARVRAVGDAADRLPLGLDLQQFGRQVPDGLGDLLLLLLPAFGADLAERRPLGAGADVLLHQGDILDGDLDLDVVGVLDREILRLAALFLDSLGAEKLADAVGDVHDVLPGLQVGQRIHRRGRAGRPLAPPQGVLTEQLVMADHDGVERLDDKALVDIAQRQLEVVRQIAADLLMISVTRWTSAGLSQ